MFALKGNIEAVSFVTMLFGVLHFWDDLEDRDQKISRDSVNAVMYNALIDLPRNSFYQANFNYLSPLIEIAILNWHAANAMEATESLDDKRIAFISRSDYCSVMIACARLVGGFEWANKITPFIRRYWHSEGFDQYLLNLKSQQAHNKEIHHVL